MEYRRLSIGLMLLVLVGCVGWVYDEQSNHKDDSSKVVFQTNVDTHTPVNWRVSLDKITVDGMPCITYHVGSNKAGLSCDWGYATRPQ